MKTEIESLKSKLTDRPIYQDLTGKILNTGDICLISSLDSLLPNNRKHYKTIKHKNYANGNIGIFVKINNRNESKMIFGLGNKKLKAFTFHDKDFPVKQNDANIITLNCIAGNYQNMDEDWKKRVKFDETLKAFEIIKQNFNK